MYPSHARPCSSRSTSMIVIAPVAAPALSVCGGARVQHSLLTRAGRTPVREPPPTPPRQPRDEHGGAASSAPRVEWRRVLAAAAVAAIATSCAQLVGTPIDVAQRLVRASGGRISFPSALLQTVRTGTLFHSLPLHLMKRTPTKCLTASLVECAAQTIDQNKPRTTASSSALSPQRQPLSALEHLSLAVSCGAMALVATYPLHLTYYALRKGTPCAAVLQVLRSPRHAYAGIIPAIASLLPSVAVDFSIYKSMRAKVTRARHHVGPLPKRTYQSTLYASASTTTSIFSPSEHQPQTRISFEHSFRLNADFIAIILAASVASPLAGIVAEPLKAMSRPMAADSIRCLPASRAPSLAATASEMLKLSGPGEFWRGYGARAIRSALCAATAKVTAETLRAASG